MFSSTFQLGDFFRTNVVSEQNLCLCIINIMFLEIYQKNELVEEYNQAVFHQQVNNGAG